MAVDSSDAMRGKTRLDSARYAADLSGKDFENVFADSTQTLSHSFLNGSSFKDSIFIETPIDQTELAEAEILGCRFERGDFTGSSFIGARVDDSLFVACNFTDGEWRKSRFRRVKFVDCNFHYTTMNLCTFDSCSFTGEGAKKIDNRSVNYNVFTRTEFDFSVADEVVLASNFGLPTEKASKSLANYGAGISLEEICLRSRTGKIVISELVDAIENEFRRSDGRRLKVLRLEFVSNIVIALGTIERVSATSLEYLERFFLMLARSAKTESDALAAMGVLLNIRSLLVDITAGRYSGPKYESALCTAIDVHYDRTYGRAEAEVLARILAELAHAAPGTFSISRFANGSTIIEMIALHAVAVGAALTAINYALRQANVTLVQTRELKTNTTKLLKEFSKKNKSKRRATQTSRVPALQRSGAPTKEMLSLRRVIDQTGRTAVDL